MKKQLAQIASEAFLNSADHNLYFTERGKFQSTRVWSFWF